MKPKKLQVSGTDNFGEMMKIAANAAAPGEGVGGSATGQGSMSSIDPEKIVGKTDLHPDQFEGTKEQKLEQMMAMREKLKNPAAAKKISGGGISPAKDDNFTSPEDEIKKQQTIDTGFGSREADLMEEKLEDIVVSDTPAAENTERIKDFSEPELPAKEVRSEEPPKPVEQNNEEDINFEKAVEMIPVQKPVGGELCIITDGTLENTKVSLDRKALKTLPARVIFILDAKEGIYCSISKDERIF